jgi:hypothetical protein
MKQLLSLFLFLVPCLAWAQYPSNGNQKITLGEQTTADGLIWRGVLGDTALITPLSDTSAYIILDTANHRFYNYNRATNVWSVAGGGTAVTTFSAGTTGLTPSTATSGAVTLAGTLAVANGGTGQTTLAAAGINTGSGTINFIPKYTATGTTLGNSAISDNGTTITATNRSIYNTGNNNFIRVGNYFNIGGSGSDYGSIGFNIGYTTTNDTYKYLFGDLSSAIKFNGGGFIFFTAPSGITDSTIIYTERMRITNAGDVGIGITPTQKLHINGNARITAMNAINDIGADANGVLQAATSDMNLKNTIENSPFGLNEILLLNPVTFLYNDVNRKLDSDVKEVGFIAQDVFDIIPNAVSSTGMGDLQLDYRAITATLVKAIQEQQALIKALEQRIINLENK